MSDPEDFMLRQTPKQIGELLGRAALAAGCGPADLAKPLQSSRRTVSRWISNGTRLNREQLVFVSRLAYPRDRALASEIAAAGGETLVTLGVEAASAATAHSVLAGPRLADVVVCAAAEAMDASPRAIRPAPLAALRAAREVGLTLETLEALLAASAPKA